MKTILLITIGCLGLFISACSFADAGQYYKDSYATNSCHGGYCPQRYCSECQCSDPGYYWNTCISKSKYCHAFGNIGSR